MAVRLQAFRRARVRGAIVVAAAALSLTACATAPPTVSRSGMRGLDGAGRTGPSARPRAYNRPYQVRGRWYTPQDQPGYDKTGLASWYSYEARSRTTADGELFDARLASAAHTTLPIPSWIEVTNLDNNRSARIRLNDRGPFVSGRILDVSRGAAEELGFVGHGVAHVRVRYLGPASLGAADPLWARTSPPAPAPAAPPRVLVSTASSFHGPSANAEVAEDVAAAGTDDVQATDHLDPSTPAPVSTTEAERPASRPGGGFAVQAGAFADRRNAERAAERLADSGATQIRPLQRANGAMLYRVIVGDWTQAGEAASACSHIAGLGFAGATVVSR